MIITLDRKTPLIVSHISGLTFDVFKGICNKLLSLSPGLSSNVDSTLSDNCTPLTRAAYFTRNIHMFSF